MRDIFILHSEYFSSVCGYFINGLQAGAPEGACHDNVKKCFTKNWEVFWNVFPFLHRWIWCDEEIKEHLKFYAYFTRMQKFFHFRHWEFFFKRQLCFSGKKCFLSIFFQRWLMITVHNIWLHHFSFFILRCNVNTRR